MTKCQFCKKNIEQEKLMLHEIYCERNCIKCDRCGNTYDQNDSQSHEQEYHSFKQCPNCKQSFEDLNKHICEELPILCQYCKLEIPIKSFSLHDIQCGSRTEVCESCKQYVIIREFSKHQQICQQKKFDKQGRGEIFDDFPSIQEITKLPQVPRTYDQFVNKKYDQQKQTNFQFQTIQAIDIPIQFDYPEKPTSYQSYKQDNIGDQKTEFQANLNYGNNYSLYDQNKKFTPDSAQNVQYQQQFDDLRYNQPMKLNQGLRFIQGNQEQNKYFNQEDKYQVNNQFPLNQTFDQESTYTQDYTYQGNQKFNTRLPLNTDNIQEHFNDYDQKSKLSGNQQNEFNQYALRPQLPEKLQQNQYQLNNIYNKQNSERFYQNEYQKPSIPFSNQIDTNLHQQYPNNFNFNVNRTIQNQKYQEVGNEKPLSFNQASVNYNNYYDGVQVNSEQQQKLQNNDQFKYNPYVSSQMQNNNNPILNDNAGIATNLYEQSLAEELQMTETQIIEQKQLYKMMEQEKVKQQLYGINYPKQNYQETIHYPQSIQPNEFDFMTEEEKQLQRQLLESIELKQQRRR